MFFKKNRDSIIFGVVLLAFTSYVLLDTFVIPRSYESTVASEDGEIGEDGTASEEGQSGKEEISENNEAQARDQEPGDTESKSEGRKSGKRKRRPSDTTESTAEDNSKPDIVQQETSEDQTLSLTGGTVIDSYNKDDKTITLYEYRVQDTQIYVADVVLKDAGALQTAFANETYGKNVTAKTSEIASVQGAVLAVNGDYYGARESGYVIRNGQLYRSISAGDQEDLVIYGDGAFEVINESEITAEALLEKGAMQVLSFGPALLQNGDVAVSAGEEVGKAMASNPRTAIGMIDDLHYVFVVSDGRTGDSEGLSLSELAAFMKTLGIKTAYNLDGGGSSTMYFNGQVVNQPTTSGRSIKERSVSDIVYIR